MTSFAQSLSVQTNPWSTILPAKAGFAPDLDARLDQAIVDKRVWNVHGLVVLRNGRLVLKRYFEGADSARGIGDIGRVKFAPDTLHDLRSCSKSIVGLLYGIALQQGKVPAPEAPLLSAFPEYADLANDASGQMTIHHVLSMTMGTDWDESTLPYIDPNNSETAMDQARDRYRYILERPVVGTPGTRWTYCGGATALLARLIAKGSGKSLHDFAPVRPSRHGADAVGSRTRRRAFRGVGRTHVGSRFGADRSDDARSASLARFPTALRCLTPLCSRVRPRYRSASAHFWPMLSEPVASQPRPLAANANNCRCSPG